MSGLESLRKDLINKPFQALWGRILVIIFIEFYQCSKFGSNIAFYKSLSCWKEKTILCSDATKLLLLQSEHKASLIFIDSFVCIFISSILA